MLCVEAYPRTQNYHQNPRVQGAPSAAHPRRRHASLAKRQGFRVVNAAEYHKLPAEQPQLDGIEAVSVAVMTPPTRVDTCLCDARSHLDDAVLQWRIVKKSR
jgi:hypothetical protein